MMTKEPLVSVVIATYNMGQYLPEAVRSVLDQNWRNLELIVVDDGSTDDTPDVMKSNENDCRVRYIKTHNQGQPRAKNLGLKEAAGNFIGFCDADDIWHPDKLKIQIPEFSDPSVGVVYSDVNYIDQIGKPVIDKNQSRRFSGKVTNQLMIKNFIPFGTAIIRKDCVEKSGCFDNNLPMGIDWDLWLRYSLDWNFTYIPKKTYTYRIWPGQMSRNYRGRYENAIRILNKFLESHHDDIPDRIVARAWADMYTSRAMDVAKAEKSFYEPLRDILHGLKYDLLFYPGWKSLGKLIIRRV